jgi:transcriptional repressor NrdR
MICPICYFEDTKVIDSRVASDGLSIRRRRECEKCGFRFSTFEEMEILDLTVVKRDGQKEAYGRDKLISGLKKALEKRPIDDDGFKKLVHNIERDIQQLKKSEIDSQEIGSIVMSHLKEIDVVAYIRFASVYESFKDANDFSDTLKKLICGGKSKVRRGITLRNKSIFKE